MLPVMQLLSYSRYEEIVRSDTVPRPWLPLQANATTRVVTHLMGQIDMATGPNPKILAQDGTNLFDIMANDRPALYIVTDATMTDDALYDSNKKALRIEGTNYLASKSDMAVEFAGCAKDIDGTGKIDIFWQTKVNFDGFVECRVIVHPIAHATMNIRWMWLEWEFDHSVLKHMQAPYNGCTRSGAFRETTAAALNMDEDRFRDSTIGLDAGGFYSQPHEKATYNASYPTNLSKLHLWMGSTNTNAAAGTDANATLFATGSSAGPHRTTPQDSGISDTQGGLQQPMFSFGTCATGHANSHTDKGWWFGMECDANHRNGRNSWGDGSRSPRAHFFFDVKDAWSNSVNYVVGDIVLHSSVVYRCILASGPAGAGAKTPSSEPTYWTSLGANTGRCKVRVDIIGCTGGERDPEHRGWPSTTFDNTWGKVPWITNTGDGGSVSAAGIDKPLLFAWYWQSLPTKPRNSVDWKHFRPTNRWTVEAQNYGSGTFANQLPSTNNHTPLSTRRMYGLQWNYLELNRRGYIWPDHDAFDAHVVDGSADDLWEAWAYHWVNPARDLGAKLMPNVTLLEGTSMLSDSAGLWPAPGDEQQRRRFPWHPLLDPFREMEWMRIDIGKTSIDANEFSAGLSASNRGGSYHLDWGHPEYRKFLVDEVRHALASPDLGAIYYDNFEVARNAHFRTRRNFNFAVQKSTLQYGTVGQDGAARVDRTNTGKTYTALRQVDHGVFSNTETGSGGTPATGVHAKEAFRDQDVWGECYTMWDILDKRETALALYRLHEAAGKPMVGHHFGSNCPPIHAFCHYLVFGEELVGLLGVGSNAFYRYPGTTAFTPHSNPYSQISDTYWDMCWMTGTAPLLLTEFGRVTGGYIAQGYSDSATSGLLQILHDHEVQLFPSNFTTTTAWSNASNYVTDTVVVQGGRQYVAKQASGPSGAGAKDPTTETAYWGDIGSNTQNCQLIADWWDQTGTWRA